MIQTSESIEQPISNPSQAFRTRKSGFFSFFCFGLGVCILFFSIGWIPWNGIRNQRDPLKKTVHMECEGYVHQTTKFDFPPSNPNPSIDMQAQYPIAPSGLEYPPLIGDVSVVVQFDYELGNFVGSPSVLKIDNDTWIASMDVKIKSHIHDARAWNTQIFMSFDQGRTWTKKATIQKLTWGSLFTVHGEVYIVGVTDKNTKLSISRMINFDRWTKTTAIVSQFRSVHTGNVGVLVTEDKVQTAIKNGREKDLYVIYAFHKKDDLMKPWRISNVARDRLRDFPHFMNSLLNTEFTLSEEAVMVPYGKKHAQIILRVNNEELCGLSERYLWNLKTNELHFLKLSIDPGWGAAHGFVVYDPVSEFYWMVSHYCRDSARDIEHLSLYLPSQRTCALDRSILGLYYNKHLTDSWHLAGFVTYSPDFAHHASYPFLVLDGDDLVFVARAHLGGPFNETTVNHGHRVCTAFSDSAVTANNHNSNMVIFNRISNFRKYIHPMMWYGKRMDNPWANYSQMQ